MLNVIKEFAEYFSINYFHYVIYISLFLLLFLVIKSSLVKDIYSRIKKDKKFFIILTLIALMFHLFLPHMTLTYFDEQAHVAQANNIVRGDGPVTCQERSNGVCLKSNVPTTAIGPSSIYSLIHSEDTSLFEIKIRYLNILLYYFVFLIIYALVYNISNNKSSSRIASGLILLLPMNIILSASVMPETLAIFFLSLSLYYLYSYIKSNVLSTLVIFELIAFFLSVMILVSIRIEYVLLLCFGGLLILYNSYMLLKEKPKILFRYFLILFVGSIPIMLLSINIITFFLNKVFGEDKSSQITIGLDYFNLVFLGYYIKNIVFMLLIIGIIYYLYREFLKFKGKKYTIVNVTNVIIFLIFVVNIFLFTLMKSGVSTFSNLAYRHMLPINTIFIILSSIGIGFIITSFLRYKILTKKGVNVVLSIFLFLVISFSAGEIGLMHDVYSERDFCSLSYISFIKESQMKGMFDDKSFIVMPYSFIGDYMNFDNFIDGFNGSYKHDQLYLLNGPYMDISNDFIYSVLHENDMCKYGIYEIK